MAKAGIKRASATKRRTQEERRLEAERRMFEAAAQIVAEEGLEGLTLHKVGESAGYSRGLPGHYFGNKEGLVTALANHIVDSFATRLDRVNPREPGMDYLRHSIAQYFETVMKNPVRARALYVLFGAAVTSPVLKPAIAVLYDKAIMSHAKHISAGMRDGTIRTDVDPRLQATLILSSLRGAVSQWLIAPGAIDLRKYGKVVIDALSRNLEPKRMG